jgi:hypothetical protein
MMIMLLDFVFRVLLIISFQLLSNEFMGMSTIRNKAAEILPKAVLTTTLSVKVLDKGVMIFRTSLS